MNVYNLKQHSQKKDNKSNKNQYIFNIQLCVVTFLQLCLHLYHEIVEWPKCFNIQQMYLWPEIGYRENSDCFLNCFNAGIQLLPELIYDVYRAISYPGNGNPIGKKPSSSLYALNRKREILRLRNSYLFHSLPSLEQLWGFKNYLVKLNNICSASRIRCEYVILIIVARSGFSQ